MIILNVQSNLQHFHGVVLELLGEGRVLPVPLLLRPLQSLEVPCGTYFETRSSFHHFVSHIK